MLTWLGKSEVIGNMICVVQPQERQQVDGCDLLSAVTELVNPAWHGQKFWEMKIVR